MKKGTSLTPRIISMILAIILVFYVLPISAIAEEVKSYPTSPSSNNAEIDNSTTPPRTYINEPYEEASLREESVKHFRLEDGSFIATQYSSPVHFRDESGAWQNIDNTLTESGSELVTSDARVKFIKKTTGNGSLFTLHDGNTKITLSLVGANKKVSGIVTNTEETETTEIGKLMSLEGLTSRIRYNEILDGVDIEYVLDSLSIKENIIIKEKNDEYSYTFTLALNGLEAELLQNGDISITKSGEQKYKIPAPVVFDSADSAAPSSAAGYSLTDNGNGKYTLTVSVSSEWMNSSDRVFPVTLDPAIIEGSSAILDTYGTPGVTSGLASSTTLRVSDYITLVKLNALPTLPTGAKVSNATLTMFRTSGTEAYVGVSTINSSWSQTAVNVSNLTYGSVLDYAYTKVNGDGSYGIDGNGAFVWDITKAVRSWYDGTANYGIALQRLSTSGNVFFASVEYSDSAKRPSFTISYVNTLGIEDYYSYSTQSGGAAGTGYVNYATGDLTFAISTLTSTDHLMPVTPTLVYNSPLANSKYTSSTVNTANDTSYMPNGFKLNLDETIVRRSYSSSGATVYYYVWADADGTEHFFYQDENDPTLFLDDSGLLLNMVVNTDTYDGYLYPYTVITITDIDKTVRTFERIIDDENYSQGPWYLTAIKDKVGNKVIFSYGNYGVSELRLYPKNSGNIRTLRFIYTSGILRYILSKDTSRCVALRYSDTYNGAISTTASKYLRQVVYAHGTGATLSSWSTYYSTGSATSIVTDATMYYEYDANGYLLSAKNGLADYTVNYEWANGKVSSVYEKGGTTQGTKIGFTYGTGYTEVTTPGSDGYYTSTADNIINHYTYDGFFRILSHYSTSYDRSTVYGTSFGKYTDDSDISKNKIQESTFANGISSNYILNGSFLITSPTDAVPYWETSHSSIEVLEDGRNAELKIPYTAGETYTVYQYVYLPVADKYTLSFDIETNYTKNIIVEADVLSGSTSLLESSRVNVDNINETDQRYTHSATFETTAATTVKVQFKVKQVTGATVANNAKVYIANVRLEQGIGSSAFNYVNMGDFVDTYRTSSGDPIDVKLDTVWYDKSDTSYYTSGSHPFKNTLKINGGLYNRYIKQTFYTAPQSFIDNYVGSDWSTNTGATYIVSGFAKATEGAVSNSHARFALRVDVYYYQGEGIDDIVVSHYFDFNSDSTDWQYVSGKFNTKYEPEEFVLGEFYDIVRKIDVVCEFKYQPSGTAYFDKIAVVEDISGTTNYTYNDRGLLAITETRNETEYREYDGSGNLSRIANNSGDLCDFEYDEESGLLKSETYYSFTRTDGIYRYKYPYGEENISSKINKTGITQTSYEYNTYGLLKKSTTTSLAANSSGTSIVTENTYVTSSGSAIFGALLTTSDGAGHTQKYFYDTSRGYLLAEVNVGDMVGTAYTYDAIGNLVSVKPATCNSTGSSYSVVNGAESVTYVYNVKNELASITTGSTTYNFTYDALGRISGYIHDDITYSYTPDGKLSSIEYGTGEFEYLYTYDALGRLAEEIYHGNLSETTIKKYEYTADGKLYRVYDALNDEYTHYSYDINGRLEHIIQYDSDRLNDFSVNYSYRMTAGKEHMVHMQHYFFNYAVGTSSNQGHIWSTYSYGDDDSLVSLRLLSGDEEIEATYTYDDFKRPSKTTVTNGNLTSETTYGYKTVNGVTTGEVVNYTVEIGNVTNAYTYEYDHRGNIVCTELNGILQYEFYYDDLGQLEYEENYITGECCSYEYDDAGNIVLRTDGIGCDEYHYEYAPSPYGDRLVSYNGEAITYDEYGRTTYYRGKAITYYEYDFNRIQSIGGTSFTYDADGMRRTKTVGGVTHTYYYDGLNLIKEEWGNNTIVFLYDASGSPIGMQYRKSTYASGVWDTYYYEKNLQGDIIAVYSAAGTKLVTYDYDAWGDISYTNYFNGGASTSVVNNPLRYRGYYYDDDLDLYYLSTRYYDPEICRFISADSYISTGQGMLGYNRYAYCGNNPTIRNDTNGCAWETIWDAISLASSVVEVVANPYDPWAWIGLAGDAADVLIPFMGGIGETTRALRAASQTAEVIDTATDVKKGWKVGEDITSLTKAGEQPKWSTLRSRYWKNKAHYFENDPLYTPRDIERMKKGLAPQIMEDGELRSMELHHILGRDNDYYYFFFEISPKGHAQIDQFRHLK